MTVDVDVLVFLLGLLSGFFVVVVLISFLAFALDRRKRQSRP